MKNKILNTLLTTALLSVTSLVYGETQNDESNSKVSESLETASTINEKTFGQLVFESTVKGQFLDSPALYQVASQYFDDSKEEKTVGEVIVNSINVEVERQTINFFVSLFSGGFSGGDPEEKDEYNDYWY